MRVQCYFMLLICSLPLGAIQPRPLKKYFEDSDFILIGTVRNVDLIRQGKSGMSLSPRGNLPGLPLYLCSFSLQIDHVLKGRPESNTGQIDVLWFVPSRTCEAQTPSQDPPISKGDTLIWFLRREGKSIRAVVDNVPATVALPDFSAKISVGLKKIEDPRVALSYVLLSRGMKQAPTSYSDTNFGTFSSVLGVAGWTGVIGSLSQLYVEANSAMRDEISLLAAHSGMCLQAARLAVTRGTGKGQNFFGARYPYLATNKFRSFETRALKQLENATSLAELRKRFGYLEDQEIKDYLVWYACTSSSQLHIRSQELLQTLFGMNPNNIPCIPCERLRENQARN